MHVGGIDNARVKKKTVKSMSGIFGIRVIRLHQPARCFRHFDTNCFLLVFHFFLKKKKEKR